MKKLLKIILAFIMTFVLNELFVRVVIKYPTYGVEKKMYGILANNQAQNIFKPYSKYWNVEGGNKVFRRNNLGLPGSDVIIIDSSKFIFVMGSSYVEAYQVDPDSMASTIFAKKIKKIAPNYEVLNLGCSGHDVMDSYLRAMYYSQIYKPEIVILVIDSDYKSWFRENTFLETDKLNFNQKSDWVTNIVIKLRNNFSFFNLAANSLNSKSKEINQIKNESVTAELNDYSNMKGAIHMFINEFKQSFICISISDKTKMNKILKAELLNYECSYYVDEENKGTEFRINGSGHLNKKGNKKLGEFIYDKIVSSYLGE